MVNIPEILSTYKKYGQYTRNTVNIPEIWQHTINMVNIPLIWSTYQIYCQHTRNMVNIPEIQSANQRYGQHTRNMVNILLIWSTYQKYDQHTKNIVNIPEIWSIYHKYSQHTRNMVNIPLIWSTYQKYGKHTRNMVNIPDIWTYCKWKSQNIWIKNIRSATMQVAWRWRRRRSLTVVHTAELCLLVNHPRFRDCPLCSHCAPGWESQQTPGPAGPSLAGARTSDSTSGQAVTCLQGNHDGGGGGGKRKGCRWICHSCNHLESSGQLEQI